MTTIGIQSSTPSAQLPTGTQAKGMQLNASDFIKMMVTQLQNQDPTQPASSDQLLAQMSQIGQLQSSTQLQTSLSGMVTQNQIGAAGNLIGKSVTGTDAQNNTVKGVVNSVRVVQNQVFLELDSGGELPMGNVATIAPGPVVAPVATTPTTIPKAA